MKNSGSASFTDMHAHDVAKCKQFKSPTVFDKWGMETKHGGTFYFKTKQAALLRLQYLDERYDFIRLIEPIG